MERTGRNAPRSFGATAGEISDAAGVLLPGRLDARRSRSAARQAAGNRAQLAARGRELLRKRLLRRGISLSAEGASAALLASVCATAEAVPVPLRMATLKAAHLFVMGENAMTLLSPQVAALVRKGLTAMLVAKLKSGVAGLLMAALLIAGSGWAAHRCFVAEPAEQLQARADDAPPKQAASEERPRTDAHGDPLPPGAVARLGTVRFRHEGGGHQFALSPDGRTLAAVVGKSVAFWDISTGRLTRRFTFIFDMQSLAFAPDGKSLAVGGKDCIARLFDLVSGKESRRFVGHQVSNDPRDIESVGIWGVAFSPDGKELITWGSDKTVRCLGHGFGPSATPTRQQGLVLPTSLTERQTLGRGEGKIADGNRTVGRGDGQRGPTTNPSR